MKSLPNSTSGVILLSDPFTISIFTLTCYQTTKELKVSGMIGHGISPGKKLPCVGKTQIGIGQTSAWKINTISPRTSTRVYFEVVTPADQPLRPGSRGLIQFVRKTTIPVGRSTFA